MVIPEKITLTLYNRDFNEIGLFNYDDYFPINAIF